MQLSFDDYVLDVARRELWRGSEPIATEPQVFELLAYLVQHWDRVVSREELLRVVWGGRIVSESAIDNRINAARRAIGDSGEAQRLIRTVPRKGFSFIGTIKEHAADPTQAITPQTPDRRGVISPALIAAAASALLSGALALFLLWLGAGPPWAVVVHILSGGTPMVTSAVDLRLPIAVLPFRALSDSTDQPNLSTNLTEYLTTELSRDQGLLVATRMTASAYFKRAVDATQIGRELRVRYIVDGSVEQVGGQIRVAARLADAETGTYLWADRYDRPAGNLLDWEDEIGGRIVNALHTGLVLREAHRPRADADAARLIWRGSALLRMAASQETYSEAARVFERALEIAPASIPARIGLASALAISTFGPFHTDYGEGLRRASGLIDTALAAVPNNAVAHFVKARVLHTQGRCEEAIGEYEMAIALDRNLTNAYALLGLCKLATGAIGDVIPLEERAIRLDPFDPFVGGYYQRIGMAELFQFHVNQAISLLEKARTAYATRQNDRVYQADSWLAAAYALNGETSRAAEALGEARKSRDYPASITQYRSRVVWATDPDIRARVDATYFKGLRLAGLPEE